MPLSEKNAQLNIATPKPLYGVIKERAAALRWSAPAFALEIIRWWESQGCPALNPADRAMILSKQMEKAKRK